MKRHNWKMTDMGRALICSECKLPPEAIVSYPTCPPPWGAQLERETPKPGGLDRLGVVKELRELAAMFGWAWDASRLMMGPVSLKVNRNLEAAVPRLQQLVTRLEGQGADESVGVKNPQATDASEPEGQCSKLRKPDPCEGREHTLSEPFEIDDGRLVEVCSRCCRGFSAGTV